MCRAAVAGLLFQAVCTGAAVAVPPCFNATWLGGEGLWSDPANWSLPPVVPTAVLDHHVLIDRGNPVVSHVMLDIEASVRGLTLDADDTLSIFDGGRLVLQLTPRGPAVENAGRIRLLGTPGQPARIVIAQPNACTLFGDGEIHLLEESGAVIQGFQGTESLKNLDNTIRGAGRLGAATLGIENAGSIIADIQFKRLTIQPSALGLINLGRIEARSGGHLNLAGVCENWGGVIEAQHASFVNLDGAVIRGGTLSTSGNGIIRTMSAPAAWNNLVLSGRYMLGPTSLTLGGTIVNDGLIEAVGGLTVAPPELTSEVLIDPQEGTVHLDGDGVLAMVSCDILPVPGAAFPHLVNGPEHAIVGRGKIGGGAMDITNHGLIGGAGGTLLLHVGSGRLLINEGTLRAEAGAAVLMVSGTLDNRGVVELVDGAIFQTSAGCNVANLVSGILVGGTWRVLAGPAPTTLSIAGSNIIINFADVTLSGPGAAFPRLNYFNTNAGVFRLEGGKTFTAFSNMSNQGEIRLSANSALNVPGQFAQTAGGTLRIEIGEGGQAGRVLAAGGAQLGGALEIVLAADAVLDQGDDFEILAASQPLAGAFSSVSAPDGLQVIYQPNAVFVVVTE